MLRNWLRNFMIGRYGPDQFNFALIVTAFIVSIIGSIADIKWFSIIVYILLIYAMLRLLSKKLEKRRRENDIFLRYWWPLRQKTVNFFKRLKSRKTHKFFKCPGCKNTLRVPKGKGQIQITCPKCGERFVRKT